MFQKMLRISWTGMGQLKTFKKGGRKTGTMKVYSIKER